MKRGSVNWVARQLRLLRPGRSALARRWDRIEALLVVLAIGLCLAAVPVAAAIGSSIYTQQTAIARQQAAERHQVTAITKVTAANGPTGDAPASAQVMVPATWRGADRAEHTAPVPVDAMTPAGSHVPVWLDRAGKLTQPPIDDTTVVGEAVSASMLTVIGCVLTAIVGLIAGRQLLDRRRAAGWARAWEHFSGGRPSRS